MYFILFQFKNAREPYNFRESFHAQSASDKSEEHREYSSSICFRGKITKSNSAYCHRRLCGRKKEKESKKTKTKK